MPNSITSPATTLDTHVKTIGAESMSPVYTLANYESNFDTKFTPALEYIAGKRDEIREDTITYRGNGTSATAVANRATAKSEIDAANVLINAKLTELSNLVKTNDTERNTHINSSFEVIRALAHNPNCSLYYEDDGSVKLLKYAKLNSADEYEIVKCTSRTMGNYDTSSTLYNEEGASVAGHYYSTTDGPLYYFIDDMLKSGFSSREVTYDWSIVGGFRNATDGSLGGSRVVDTYNTYDGTVSNVYYGANAPFVSSTPGLKYSYRGFTPRSSIYSMSVAAKKRILKAMKDIFRLVIEKSDIQNCYMKTQTVTLNNTTTKIYHFNPLYSFEENFRFQIPRNTDAKYPADLRGDTKNYRTNYYEATANTAVRNKVFRSKPSEGQAASLTFTRSKAFEYSFLSTFANESSFSNALNTIASYREKMYLFFVPDKYKKSVSNFVRIWSLIHARMFAGKISELPGGEPASSSDNTFFDSPGIWTIPLEDVAYSKIVSGARDLIKRDSNFLNFKEPRNLDYDISTKTWGTLNDLNLNHVLKTLYRKHPTSTTYTTATDVDTNSDYEKVVDGANGTKTFNIFDLAPNHPVRKRRELLFISEFFGSYRAKADTKSVNVSPAVEASIDYAYPHIAAGTHLLFPTRLNDEDIKYSTFRYLLRDDIFIDKFRRFFLAQDIRYTDDAQVFIPDIDNTSHSNNSVTGPLSDPNTKTLSATSADRAKYTLRNAFKAFSQFSPYDDTKYDGITEYKTYPSKDTALAAIYAPCSRIPLKFINLDAVPLNIDVSTIQAETSTNSEGPMVSDNYYGGVRIFSSSLKATTDLVVGLASATVLYPRKVEFLPYIKTSIDASNLITLTSITEAQIGASSFTLANPYKVGNASPFPQSICVESCVGQSNHYMVNFYRNYGYIPGGKLDIPSAYLPENIDPEVFKKCYLRAFDYLASLESTTYIGGIDLVKGSVSTDVYYNGAISTSLKTYMFDNIINSSRVTGYTNSYPYNNVSPDSYLEALRTAKKGDLTPSEDLYSYFIDGNYDIFKYFKTYFLASRATSAIVPLHNPYLNLAKSGFTGDTNEYDVTRNTLNSMSITTTHVAKTTVGNAQYNETYNYDVDVLIDYNVSEEANRTATRNFLLANYTSANDTAFIDASTYIYEENVNLVKLTNNTYSYNQSTGLLRTYIPYHTLFYMYYVKPYVVGKKILDFDEYVGNSYRYVVLNSEEYLTSTLQYMYNHLPSVATHPVLRTYITNLYNTGNTALLSQMFTELIQHRVANQTFTEKPITSVDIQDIVNNLERSVEIRAYLAKFTYDGTQGYKDSLNYYMLNYNPTQDTLNTIFFKTYQPHLTDIFNKKLDAVLRVEHYNYISRNFLKTVESCAELKEAFNSFSSYIIESNALTPVITRNANIASTNSNIVNSLKNIILNYEQNNPHYSYNLTSLFGPTVPSDTLASNLLILQKLAKSYYIRKEFLNSSYVNYSPTRSNNLKNLILNFFGISINDTFRFYQLNSYVLDEIIEKIFDNTQGSTTLTKTTLNSYSLQDYTGAVADILNECSTISTWRSNFKTLLLANNEIVDFLIYKKDGGDKFEDLIRMIRSKIDRPIPDETFRAIYNNLMIVDKVFLTKLFNEVKQDIDKITEYEILNDLVKISEYSEMTPPVAGAIKVVDKKTYKVLPVSEEALKAVFRSVSINNRLVQDLENKYIRTITIVDNGWRKIWKTYLKYKQESESGIGRPINELDIILSGITLNRQSISVKNNAISKFDN